MHLHVLHLVSIDMDVIRENFHFLLFFVFFSNVYLLLLHINLGFVLFVRDVIARYRRDRRLYQSGYVSMLYSRRQVGRRVGRRVLMRRLEVQWVER